MEKASTSGRDYASRPTSYKSSLSLKIDRYTTRQRSRLCVCLTYLFFVILIVKILYESFYYFFFFHMHKICRSRSPVIRTRVSRETTEQLPPSRKKMSAEALERLARLKETYGDGGATSSSAISRSSLIDDSDVIRIGR